MIYIYIYLFEKIYVKNSSICINLFFMVHRKLYPNTKHSWSSHRTHDRDRWGFLRTCLTYLCSVQLLLALPAVFEAAANMKRLP